MAERRFGPIGVAGVYGVGPVIRSTTPNGVAMDAQRFGWLIDQGREIYERPELPARAATLDEVLLVIRRDGPLRFDPSLGFHMYGADICLQAAERGLAVVVVSALCYHNSRNVGLPKAYFASARLLPANGRIACRWQPRARSSTCDGKVRLLGNTPLRHDRQQVAHHRNVERIRQ